MRRALAVGLLSIGAVFLAAACGGDATPTPTSPSLAPGNSYSDTDYPSNSHGYPNYRSCHHRHLYGGVTGNPKRKI